MAGDVKKNGGGAPDDEYKKATKEVVDDMLRVDVLGPRIVAVLCDHTPASAKIHNLIADAIAKEPQVRTALETVIGDIDARRKNRWIERILSALGGAALAIFSGVGIYYLTHLPAIASEQPAQLPSPNITKGQVQH